MSLQLRKRWLAAALPLGLFVSGPGSRDGLLVAPFSRGPGTPPPRTEKERLISLGQKLSQLEQQLARLGVKPASGIGGRGGPELPVTLADLEQESERLSDRVQVLSTHREALSTQLRRRYDLALPLANLPLGVPLRGGFDYTSGFGLRSDPWTGAATAHNGIDLAADHGATIVANAPGRVVACEYRSGYGLMLEINHGGGLATRYGHLSACRAKPGELVLRDQSIAAVGNSGRSTGPHLHYEVLIKGRAIDPAPLVWLSSAPPV